MLRTTKGFALVAALVLCAACGKKADETAAADAAAPVPTPEAPADAGAADTGEVASYPTQIPQGGTKITRVSFQVRAAADPSSKLLTTIGPGTAINLKASYSSWMLIEWPSGVGQLSPGWINLDRNDASKVADAPANVDAGAPVDAGAADAAVDAGAKADAGDGGRAVRPVIKVPPKKK